MSCKIIDENPVSGAFSAIRKKNQLCMKFSRTLSGSIFGLTECCYGEMFQERVLIFEDTNPREFMTVNC